MSYTRISRVAGFATLVSLLLIGGGAVAETSSKKTDYTSMTPQELADYLIFDAKGFKLDVETQEGGTVRDRLTQDDLQKTCSALQGAATEGDTAKRVTEMARKDMTYPDGGVRLGDWKKGEELARSGYGFRVGHNTDEHGEKVAGGNCYACHQLDPTEIAYGTLGPSLQGYGKTRGTGDAMLKYTYEMIYNPHAYFPCTKMPRFGANEFLTQQQIADIMAYVMSPESPVNK